MRKEPVMEIFLLSAGAFVGTFMPAIEVLGQFKSDPTKVGYLGLLTMLLASGTLAVALVTGYLWYQRGKSQKTLVESIRSRPRIPVTQANENVA